MAFQKDEGTLAGLAPGKSAIVHALVGADAVSLRLLEMGLSPGVRVDVVKRAPFGDPIELRVRGFHLSVRKQEAARVQIRDLPVGGDLPVGVAARVGPTK